jgi:small-conductance mechanosensitive channel
VRKILLSSIKQKEVTKQEKILLKKRITQILSFILSVMLIILWFTQLQVFFVSLFAIAAAIVVALKELIMCLTGGILIKSSRVFKVGDRIDIDSARGFVIEKNLLTTKVLEIGPEKNSQQTTGEIIAIPNSLMLSKTLKNESYFKGYSIKSFVFKVADPSKTYLFETEISDVANTFCLDYLEEAKKNISKFCEKEGLVVPSINPKTKIIIEDGKDISVLVKLPVRNSEVADIEQLLNRFYVDWINRNKTEVKSE